MKIGLFTDCHYCMAEEIGGGRNPLASYKKVKNAMTEFKNQNVDVVFCLGDLVDECENSTKESVLSCFKEMVEMIKSFEIPFYFIPGNHDYLSTTRKEIEENTSIRIPSYCIDKGGYRFILLDANYRSSMKCFDTEGVVWYDSNLPPEQIDFLKKALAESKTECVVLVHENLDPNVQHQHIIKNADEIRKIIKNSNKVKCVIQGHFHPGANSIIDEIPYITIPAVCEHETNYYQIMEL